jgi:hypothetical protein
MPGDDAQSNGGMNKTEAATERVRKQQKYALTISGLFAAFGGVAYLIPVESGTKPILYGALLIVFLTVMIFTPIYLRMTVTADQDGDAA